MAERSPYKPTGYSSVSIYMMADEAQRVVKFAKAVFHAEILRKMDRADGRIMHAELRIDDSIVMLSDSTEEYPAFPVWLHVYVPDVDAAYARALEAGGVSVQAPTQKGDEDRRSGVRDPAGNVWWISTRVE
ncbi:VOC family protein [Microvirga brassicacearum]|uniref:VOC family protein n=1 Tax=Microvirga brassicacearum TaxID=2580413 RepID=A0A5N3PH97_9HYPH|nr:VOC family protein [Microvirga brassicacearum]KAB0269122.1 VOC family protein [Microvirga brassicacearum]